MDEWQAILKTEFDAEEGSFLLRLRAGLDWDRQHFHRLIEAMEACCRATNKQEAFERWIAFGFWYVPQTVRDWTTGWKTDDAEYRNAAYQYLDNLAYWFFFGECPWTDDGKPAKNELHRLSGLSVS